MWMFSNKGIIFLTLTTKYDLLKYISLGEQQREVENTKISVKEKNFEGILEHDLVLLRLAVTVLCVCFPLCMFFVLYYKGHIK